jgi:hypothetical protein
MRASTLFGLAVAAAAVLPSLGCRGSTSTPPGPGSISVVSTPPLHRDRQFHTGTLLDTGDVLIAGGVDGSGAPVPEAERYRSVGQQWLSSGTMLTPRARHTASLLGDGSVVVAGGVAGGAPTGAAEVYAPWTNAWGPTSGGLATARRDHTATRVKDDTAHGDSVVFAGGADATGAPLASVERYMPGTHTFQGAGTLRAPRTQHSATLLDDGRVLIVGGIDATGAPIGSVEFYDPVTETSVFGRNPLNTPRGGHAAVRLFDGRVLVAGGSGAAGALATAEVYDPRNDISTNVPSGLTVARAAPRLTTLVDDRVLLTGSGQTAEIFDPATSIFGASGSLAQPRAGHTSTPVGAEVLIFGGGPATAPAELFDE